MTSLFYLFSSCTLVAALLVIQSRNPVHSVLFLILAFFNSAAWLVLLGLDFFAFLFLVVYVGAIAVLFLFVVMMLNVKLVEINEKRLRYLPIGAMFALLFLLELFVMFENDASGSLHGAAASLPESDWLSYSELLDTRSNISAVGMLIYTYYFLFVLLASLILLVAMIGAIVLTMHNTVTIKRQDRFQQNTREWGNTVAMLS